MKNILVILLISLAAASNSERVAQPNESDAPSKSHFEGCITYKIEIEALNPDKMTKKALREHFGDSLRWCHQGGNYRQMLKGGPTTDVWYLREHSTEYALRRNEKAILAIDITRPMMPTVGIEEKPTDDTVLNRKLHMIVADFEDGSRTEYWYDPELSIDPRHYESYQFADLNRIYAKSRSVFLKFRRRTPLYVRTHIAVEIDDEPVSADLFQLPDLPIREWK